MKATFFLLMLVFSLQIYAQPARIVLTFDDGPNPHTTKRVLDELDKRKAKAAFFILTSPEILFKGKILEKYYPKAETKEGFETLVEEVSNGHLIACHWGGTYISQLNYHPPRLLQPAYDSTGDGIVDKISSTGNALESDLIQCKKRLNEALQLANQTSPDTELQNAGDIGFIRPPVWKYKIDHLDARPTYELLGMKMVLTDGKLNDGGYSFQGIPLPKKMAKTALKAILEGKKEVVLTMHDSNTKTTRNLGETLDELEKTLKEKGLIRGVHWDYPQSVSEIKESLDNFVNRSLKDLPN